MKHKTALSVINKTFDSVYKETFSYSFYKTLTFSGLRLAGCKCVLSIIKIFFLRQYLAAMLPSKAPVTKVDHPLDDKIPFVPSWIAIYLDFVNFWVRVLSFFLRRYGRKAYKPVCDFVQDMGKLYAFAAEVYKKNFSTTKRPFYIARPRFLLIHLVDPHLMCVPSLHVMIAIYTYKMFSEFAKQLAGEESYKEQIEEMRQGAVAICHSVLFVKQHSVNCIPAALYAITCYAPELFPQREAEAFIELLFAFAPSPFSPPKGCRVHPFASPKITLPQEDIKEIRSHILNMYRRFLSEKETSKTWDEPILNFLRSMPLVKRQ